MKKATESPYIELLAKQIKKLHATNFDLEAWKAGAITILDRIFDKENSRSKQIAQLKIDYSSWALRDSNSNYKPVETAKRKGEEIINTAIDELEVFGVTDHQDFSDASTNIPEEILAMNDKKRKKHFEGMKKEKLVQLLMQITKQ